MSCLAGCNDSPKQPVVIPGDGSPKKRGGICVRCFTFWTLVLLLALGVLFHHHTNTGEVKLG